LCKECGCRCKCCGAEPTSYLDLHQQIAELHSQLARNGSHIGSLEQTLTDTRSNADFELSRTKDDMARLRERYERLLESHKKMQKINHDLEDKLLRQVGSSEGEKVSLQHELSSMTQRLTDARTLISHLDEENERYRQDCNVAVQLLQCKPSNFVSHRLNTLPLDLQDRLKQLMPRDQFMTAENAANNPPEESRQMRIPIVTFPPTAMVYSLQHKVVSEAKEVPSKTDMNSGFIPTSLIAKALNQPRPQRTVPHIFICSSCRQDVEIKDKDCQVDFLVRGMRPVEVATLPPTTERFSNSKQSFLLNSNLEAKSQGYFLHSNGTNVTIHNEVHIPTRKNCLSTSSTETEL